MIYYFFPKIVLLHSKSAVKIANNILFFCILHISNTKKCYISFFISKCLISRLVTQKSPDVIYVLSYQTKYKHKLKHQRFWINTLDNYRLVTQKSPARKDRACANLSMFPHIKMPFRGEMTYTEGPFRGKMTYTERPFRGKMA